MIEEDQLYETGWKEKQQSTNGSRPSDGSTQRSEVLQEFPAAPLREGRGQCVSLPLPAVHELASR